MLCAPSVKPCAVNVAIPEAFTFDVPSKVVPSKKLTVPFELPVGAGATVAVSVTACPDTIGDDGTDSVVVVATGEPGPGAVSVIVTAAEVDVAEVELPE